MQREQLEKMQFNVAEEIRAIRSRLEVDTANLNALTSEVRQRTRKLEDDHRLTVRDALVDDRSTGNHPSTSLMLRTISSASNKKRSMRVIFSSIHIGQRMSRSKQIDLFFSSALVEMLFPSV